MLNKKRKIRKYKFSYGKSPLSVRTLKRHRQTAKNLKKQNSPKKTKFKKTTTLITALIISIIAIYGVFFSSYFNISQINISNSELEDETMSKEIKESISDSIGENLIFTDTETLKLKILEAFPEIENVEVEKDYPKKLIVEFTKYPLVANVINESTTIKKSYVINSIGYAIKEDLENPSLPYIKIKTDEPLNPENPVIEASKLRYILEAKIYFEDKFGMRIVEIEYKKTPREIHILTEKNFYIWLDIQKTVDEQFKKLKKALVKLDIYNEDLQYIDLRIAGGNGDKIIYKRR